MTAGKYKSTGQKNKILCSTGVIIQNHSVNYPNLCRIGNNVECDGIELMFSQGWYGIEEQVLSVCKSSSLFFASIHMDKQIGEMISRNENDDYDRAFEYFEINCKMAKNLGIPLAVLHLWGGPPSDKHIELNLEAFSHLYDVAQNYGITLTIEGVVCNQQDPLTHMRRLCSLFPDKIKFTLDTRQMEFHGLLEQAMACDCLWENKRMAHVHISDYSGEYMQWTNLKNILHPGEGHIDFDSFFGSLKKRGYDGMITLESKGFYNGELDLERVNRSLRQLREMAKVP